MALAPGLPLRVRRRRLPSRRFSSGFSSGFSAGRSAGRSLPLPPLRRLRRRVHEESPLSRCLCGAACITAAEYVVGCTVNRHFRLRVWDYSHEFGNVQGQICPKYAVLWTLLAAPIMLPK